MRTLRELLDAQQDLVSVLEELEEIKVAGGVYDEDRLHYLKWSLWDLGKIVGWGLSRRSSEEENLEDLLEVLIIDARCFVQSAGFLVTEKYRKLRSRTA